MEKNYTKSPHISISYLKEKAYYDIKGKQKGQAWIAATVITLEQVVFLTHRIPAQAQVPREDWSDDP